MHSRGKVSLQCQSLALIPTSVLISQPQRGSFAPTLQPQRALGSGARLHWDERASWGNQKGALPID